jgi:hypothetical protein
MGRKRTLGAQSGQSPYGSGGKVAGHLGWAQSAQSDVMSERLQLPSSHPKAAIPLSTRS